MNIVTIHTNFNKLDFIPLRNFQTYLLDFLVNSMLQNRPVIFGRTKKVVQQENKAEARPRGIDPV